MKYEKYGFLYPPRPASDGVVHPEDLAMWEQRGYWAQCKRNGTGGILAISPAASAKAIAAALPEAQRAQLAGFASETKPARHVVAMRRENVLHKLWAPSAHTRAPFQGLPGKGWYVFVAELLHSKVKGLKDINYINDLLVANGNYLVNTTFVDRQHMLAQLFPDAVPSIDGHHFVIDEHTWLARNYKPGDNYTAIFGRLTRDEDEGLVLKKPTARMALCIKEASNSSWQKKCRREHKNYAY